MISLEQIRLLEQKVEVAVSKIKQLNEENTALKKKCATLEQENNDIKTKISVFEQDQVKIEQGIINALDRLNTVENSVLLAAGMLYPEQPADKDDSWIAPETYDTINQSSNEQASNHLNENLHQPEETLDNSFQNNEDDSQQDDFSLNYEEPSPDQKPFDIF